MKSIILPLGLSKLSVIEYIMEPYLIRETEFVHTVVVVVSTVPCYISTGSGKFLVIICGSLWI